MKGARAKAGSGKADDKLKTKSGGARKRGGKAVKDPNKPKRPPSAFFVFMEEFRKQYKAEHPDNKLVSAVGKAGGANWKNMTDAEKAPYVAKADKRKAEYNKNIKAYNMKQGGGVNEADDDESDKSKSEVNDEEKDEGSGDEEEDEE